MVNEYSFEDEWRNLFRLNPIYLNWKEHYSNWADFIEARVDTDDPNWENELLKIIEPRNGLQSLHSLFDKVFNELSPLDTYDSELPFLLNEESNIYIGIFWSEKINAGVIITLMNSNNQNLEMAINKFKTIPCSTIGELLFSEELDDSTISVFQIENLTKDAYVNCEISIDHLQKQ